MSALVYILLSPLEKKIIRQFFYEPAYLAMDRLNLQGKYKSALDILMQRLDCECEFELGVWAAKNAKLWAGKRELIELNLRHYYFQKLQNRIVVETPNIINFTQDSLL